MNLRNTMKNDNQQTFDELAETGQLTSLLGTLGSHLDKYLSFEHDDAMKSANDWQQKLNTDLPQKGVGAEQVITEIGEVVLPNGSAIPKPGFTSFITTGATSIGALATLTGSIAAPQRIGLNAFNYLEQVSLRWMAEMLELPSEMKGLYSSGGSVANLVALGAARQHAFEKIGIDPAQEGVTKPCRVYVSASCHNTVNRAVAVLGMGRKSVMTIPVDQQGRMRVELLNDAICLDIQDNILPIAIVANAGSTSTGAIDLLRAIGEIACQYKVWFHVDGAYGLPGILDPQTKPYFDGLELADSVIVDPHKWLGAPVGIGATYLRDYSLLHRAFQQGEADYLEGSVYEENIQHSMDNLGIPYNDFGVELSAPCRGAVVWAMLKEIGVQGMRARVCRHNAMARLLAEKATDNTKLEVTQAPVLSICCFRYIDNNCKDLNELNRQIHRQLLLNNQNLPSTALVNGQLSLRPCFVGARTNWSHVAQLLDEVIMIGDQLMKEGI